VEPGGGSTVKGRKGKGTVALEGTTKKKKKKNGRRGPQTKRKGKLFPTPKEIKATGSAIPPRERCCGHQNYTRRTERDARGREGGGWRRAFKPPPEGPSRRRVRCGGSRAKPTGWFATGNHLPHRVRVAAGEKKKRRCGRPGEGEENLQHKEKTWEATIPKETAG